MAAHLLDGDFRRISIMRDNHLPPPPLEPITTYETLVGYLNALNAERVEAARRLSPHILCDRAPDRAPSLLRVEGDSELAAPLISARAVMV